MGPERLPLECLFLELSRSGLSLGPRDYIDLHRAMEAGFGLLTETQLQWLCEALWARNEDDFRRIALVFENAKKVLPAGEELDGVQEGGSPTQGRKMQDLNRRRRGEFGKVAAVAEDLSIAFHSLGSNVGGAELDLPPIEIEALPDDAYIYTAKPPLAARKLCIALRRLRSMKRSDQSTELDIDGTVERKCRDFVLLEPKKRAPRRNQASLVVLLDISASMAPWHGLAQVLRESLRTSHLRQPRLYFFDNVPDLVSEHQDMGRARSLDAFVGPGDRRPILLFSDGGAARGQRSSPRLEATRSLVEDWRKHGHAIAWVNPMPAHRWTGTTAGPIARIPQLRCFELSERGLTSAIDALRGLLEAQA